MPHYLVSHRSLVEAANERAAAEAMMLSIQSATKITFTVMVDQDNMRQVVLDMPPSGIPEALRAKDAPVDVTWAATPPSAGTFGNVALLQDRSGKFVVSARMLGYGSFLLVTGLLLGMVLASL